MSPASEVSVNRVSILLLSAFVVLSACQDTLAVREGQDDDSPRLPPQIEPGFSISDAVHSAGNPHFFWLPPMVPAPEPSGVLDTSLEPSVEVCISDGTECLAPPFVTFTMTSGPGSETVRIVPEDGHFIVNWHTDQFDLSSGGPFRIQIRVSGTRLGYADVVAGSTGELKNLATEGTIPLKEGRTLPIKFRIEEGAVFVVGPEGGIVNAECAGTSLEIPAGALSAEAGVTVLPFIPSQNEVGLVPGPACDFGPDGLRFDVPAVLSMHYDETLMPPEVDKSGLMFFKYLEKGWMPLFTGDVDEGEKSLRAEIVGFSAHGPGDFNDQKAACLLNGTGCESFKAGLVQEINALESRCEEAESVEVVRPLAGAYLDLAGVANEEFSGNFPTFTSGCVSKLANLLEERAAEYETQCTATSSLELRQYFYEKWVSVAQELAELGWPLDVAPPSFCDGLYDPARTFVEINPSPLGLSPGEAGILTATLHCGINECDGNLIWGSHNPEIATVNKLDEAGETSEVTAVTYGTTRIVAKNEVLEHVLGQAQVDVREQGEEQVDILLVIQTDNSTAYWVGYDAWSCPAHLCLNYEWDELRHTNFAWKGLAVLPGSPPEYPGSVEVTDPGVVGISVSPEGPFGPGPIPITFTVPDDPAWKDVAISQNVHVKPLSVGSTKLKACIAGVRCWEQLQLWDVASSIVLDYDAVGLRDVGAEIVTALDDRWGRGRYRFGVVGFGRHPETAYCEPLDNLPEWRPYAEPRPYYDWVPLTYAPEEIVQGTGSVQLICNTHFNITIEGSTAYSALLHAIQGTDWRDDAERKIILLQQWPVDSHSLDPRPPEVISGLTLDIIVHEARLKGIEIYTIAAGRGVVDPLQEIASATGGLFFDRASSFWPLSEALPAVFDEMRYR